MKVKTVRGANPKQFQLPKPEYSVRIRLNHCYQNTVPRYGIRKTNKQVSLNNNKICPLDIRSFVNIFKLYSMLPYPIEHWSMYRRYVR